MTAALYYHPEAYTSNGPKLMGRNVAGESFLRGYLLYSTASAFCAQVEHPAHAQQFVETVRAAGRSEPVEVVGMSTLEKLLRVGQVFLPGPGIGDPARHRSAFGDGAWSLCGLTHTVSSARAMDALADLIVAPVQPWDALICTSAAVKGTVERVLQAQADYLKRRLGVGTLVLPQLPVIPLGVHTADFEFPDTRKAAARAALGAGPDSMVVLFVGRLSFHAKAHPLAMYQALEAASRESGKPVVLVEYGLHPNASIAQAFAQAAQRACPSVRVLTLDGRREDDRERAWAAADVLCSLSDNVQESFGIVPIEAMAAGIPVVVSDWDGYRDTVQDGVEGFRVPTLMPQEGSGADLAMRHALGVDTYDLYIGRVSSLVAVDVQATTRAFVRLFESPELRRRMGDAGRARARSVYDWKVVIGQYEALWAQLSEIRAGRATAGARPVHPWPARMDPFGAFADYPTHILTPRTVLALADDDVDSARRRIHGYRSLEMVEFAGFVLPTEAQVEQMLDGLSVGPRSAGELVAGVPAARRPFAFRSLAWLAKLGAVKVCL